MPSELDPFSRHVLEQFVTTMKSHDLRQLQASRRRTRELRNQELQAVVSNTLRDIFGGTGAVVSGVNEGLIIPILNALGGAASGGVEFLFFTAMPYVGSRVLALPALVKVLAALTDENKNALQDKLRTYLPNSGYPSSNDLPVSSPFSILEPPGFSLPYADEDEDENENENEDEGY